MGEYTIPDSCQIPKDILQQIYQEAFGYRDHGYFVEIGAFDGYTYSNTFGLAEAGWKGLYAEAVPEFAVEARRKLEGLNVKVVNTAIGDREGTTPVYLCGECSAINLDKAARAWGCTEERSVIVPITTMNSFLEDNDCPSEFSLLVIDVEGAEIAVLKHYDIERWKPYMVIIELHEDNPNEIHLHSGVNPILIYARKWFAERGYVKLYSDIINTIYVQIDK